MKHMNMIKKYSRAAALALATLLLIAAFAACSDSTPDDTDPVADDTSGQNSDTEAPVISGAKDIVTVIGREISYRSGTASAMFVGNISIKCACFAKKRERSLY